MESNRLAYIFQPWMSWRRCENVKNILEVVSSPHLNVDLVHQNLVPISHDSFLDTCKNGDVVGLRNSNINLSHVWLHKPMIGYGQPRQIVIFNTLGAFRAITRLSDSLCENVSRMSNQTLSFPDSEMIGIGVDQFFKLGINDDIGPTFSLYPNFCHDFCGQLCPSSQASSSNRPNSSYQYPIYFDHVRILPSRRKP
jgi:hypothetical protein